MSSVANPDAHLPLLAIWSTFNMFSACGNAILLTVTFLSQRSSTNLLLANLEFIFSVTGATGSLLIWTGHARSMHPPYGLCLANASMSLANVPLQAGSALAIILQACGTVIGTTRPRWRRAIQWFTSIPFLLMLPVVSGTPFFVAGLVIGKSNPSTVFRGSPFYCVVDRPAFQNAATGVGAAYTFLCLVFALWTAYTLIISRWRVRRMVEYSSISSSFVLRTLVFSVFVSIAFIVGIISLITNFASGVVPDVVLSSCGPAVFFIFSTSPPILHFVFQCRRLRSSGKATSNSSHLGPAASSSAAYGSQQSRVGVNLELVPVSRVPLTPMPVLLFKPDSAESGLDSTDEQERAQGKKMGLHI